MEQDLERFWISQAGILIRENKCLILELAGKPGFWDIPGGRLNRGELAESGFQREIKEELGIDNFLVNSRPTTIFRFKPNFFSCSKVFKIR